MIMTPEKYHSFSTTDRNSTYRSLMDSGAQFSGTQLVVSASSSSNSTSSGSRDTGLAIYQAVFVVANSALGAGVLNFPQAYSETGGVIPALIVQACLVVLIIGSFSILGHCGQVYHTSNYHETIQHFCGPTAQIICQILVVLYMFGCNVTHMIVVGDQLIKVIDCRGWYFDRKVVTSVVSCVFILPLCIPKKLRVVSYSSLLGGISAFYVCLVVVIRYYTGGYRNVEGNSSSSVSVAKIFAAVPVISFGYESHITSVAVYAELKHPTLARFGVVTVCATTIHTVIYSLTGTYGCLTFHHIGVKSDILLNYRDDDVAAVTARAFILIMAFGTYAVCLFVGRLAIIDLWVRIRQFTAAEVDNFIKKRHTIISVLWFLCSLAIALFVPTIGMAIDFIGALAAHFIFTFPGLCLIQLSLQDSMEMTYKRKLSLAVGVTYVVIGVFLFGHTVTLALMEDIGGGSLN